MRADGRLLGQQGLQAIDIRRARCQAVRYSCWLLVRLKEKENCAIERTFVGGRGLGKRQGCRCKATDAPRTLARETSHPRPPIQCTLVWQLNSSDVYARGKPQGAMTLGSRATARRWSWQREGPRACSGGAQPRRQWIEKEPRVDRPSRLLQRHFLSGAFQEA